ncbi:MAG: adenylate kinase family protein [Verrucomicrobiota bacterium]
MLIALMGCPGSGKSTLANRLLAFRGVGVLSLGRLIREAAEAHNSTGQEIRSYADAGKLVPDETIKKMIQDALNQMQAKIIVLNGFPRRMEQIPMLMEISKEQNHELKAVIVLELDRKEAEERIVGRRLCVNCGATYHIPHNLPPKKNAELTQRADDTIVTFSRRFAEYEQHTLPVVDYFKKRRPDITFTESGMESVEKILRDLFPRFQSHGISLETL